MRQLWVVVFVHGHVPGGVSAPDDLGKFELLRPSRPRRLAAVLSVAQLRRLPGAVPAGRTSRLMAGLPRGTGWGVGKCRTPRVRDIDLDRGRVIVRAGKGRGRRRVGLAGGSAAGRA